MVDPELFHKAQGIVLERSRRFTNEEMLGKLKELLDLHGKLSGNRFIGTRHSGIHAELEAIVASETVC